MKLVVMLLRLYLGIVICFCVIVNQTLAQKKTEIRVAAAADVQFVLNELIVMFQERERGITITPIFGSSGHLFAQIRSGAPFDVFFSADTTYPAQLFREGLTSESPRHYARGRLVLWLHSKLGNGESKTLGNLTVLQRPDIRKIVMANPEHAPYGKRARECLQYHRLWELVQSKMVTAENVAQAATYAQMGNVQAALLPLSLVIVSELQRLGSYYLIPEFTHAALIQSVAQLRRGAAPIEQTQRWLQFCRSPEARVIFERYGFIVAF